MQGATIRVTAIGSIAAAMLAGCGSTAPHARSGSHILTGLTAGLQGGPAEWAGDASLINAAELVTQQCMRRQGFVYFTSFVTPTQESGSAWFPFPDQSLAYAAHNGYGLHALALQDASAHTTKAVGGQGAASTDPEERYELSLRGAAKTRYVRALVGRTYATFKLVGTRAGMKYPTSGCTALGEKRAYGSIADYFDVTDQLVALGNILATRATDSLVYKRAVARWRSCMLAKGLRFTNPDAGRAGLANMPERQQVTARFQALETHVALQDIKCQGQVGLRTAYSRALAEAVPSLGTKLSADVLQILAIRARGVREANRVLGR